MPMAVEEEEQEREEQQKEQLMWAAQRGMHFLWAACRPCWFSVRKLRRKDLVSPSSVA